MSTVSRGTGGRRHPPGEPPPGRGEAPPRRTFMGVPAPPAASVDDPVEQPVEQPVERPVEDPVEQPVERPVEDPVEHGVADRVAQRVSEPDHERADGTERPPAPLPPSAPASSLRHPPRPTPTPPPRPLAAAVAPKTPTTPTTPTGTTPTATPLPAAPAAPRPGPAALGPGPALVLAAAGPVLAARSLAAADTGGDGIPLVGTGPAVGSTAAGVLALILPLAVGLAGVLLTRVRPPSRLLLVAGGGAALAIVRGLADPGADPALGLLLGLPTPWSAALAWAACAVVLTLTTTLLARELLGATTAPLALAWAGTAAAVLLPWPPGSALPFVVVAALVLGLLAGVAAAGAAARPDRPGPRHPFTLTGRADLAAAGGAGALALLLAALSARPEVAPRVGVAAAVLAVVALLLAGERLARWRAGGPLEVLVRCAGATLVVVVATGVVRASVVTDPQDGVTGWRAGLALLALGATLLAAALPRPRAPHYTRTTHLRVLRAAPWVVVALALVGGAGVVSGRPTVPGAVTSASPAVPTSTALPSTPATAPPPTSGSSGGPSSTLPGGGPRTLDVRSSPSAPPGDGPWMSVAAVSGTQVTIVIGSPVATGGLEIRTVVGNGAEISYPLVAVAPGSSQQVTVLLPQSGEFTVELHDLRRTDPLQVLTLRR